MPSVSKRSPGQLVRCTHCGVEKPWQTGRDAFKQECGKPRQPCTKCDTANRKRRAMKDPEAERIKTAKRIEKWRKDNPEKVRASWRKPRKFDKERARERTNRWRKEHPETRCIEFHKRKALKLHLPYAFTRQDWKNCLAYWNNQCCICGRTSGNGYVLAQEHWIALADPRQENPGTVPWNILLMCHARSGAKGGCNNAKWTKDPVVWLQSVLSPGEFQVKLAEITTYFDAMRNKCDQEKLS